MKIAATASSSASYETYTPEEALALMVDTGMSKEGYLAVQSGAKKRGANIYPPYNVIAEAKKKCYPDNVFVTEREARIPLKDLLEHTVKRLFSVQSEVLERIPENVNDISVIYKWGLDGSGGHSIYKQNFKDNSIHADSNIILCTVVPLEISAMNQNKKLIFWKNHNASSTKYCRPIGFKLTKETEDTVKEEFKHVQEQIDNLQPTLLSLDNGKELNVNHHLVCTMLDGKTVNTLTETSSTQACNICQATPKVMNDLTKVLARPCNVDTYKFGISILHAYLRCFEYLLHISYKMDLETWQARGKEAKEKLSIRKNRITKKFYEEMGLVVDQPKQGGGNSNDGNTARKFFENAEKVAQITGLDETIVRRFSNILITISSGHYIKVEDFKKYCVDTAKLIFDKYGWYKMSASVHKLLIHGADIIKSLPLPVGQLSEDVLEASHKQYKKIRLFHSRKVSREQTNTDIIHMLLICSDPVISINRKIVKKGNRPFPREVLAMLDLPNYLTVPVPNDDNDTSSDESISIL